MNRTAPLPVASALSALLTLIGCSASEPPPPVNLTPDLPAWPARCARPTAHATLAPGDDALTALARERGQLDAANAKAAACGRFYDDLRAGGL